MIFLETIGSVLAFFEMATRPFWVTKCKDCPTVHGERIHIMYDFVERLDLRGRQYVFISGTHVFLQLICFVHSLFHNIDYNEVNIIVWA